MGLGYQGGIAPLARSLYAVALIFIVGPAHKSISYLDSDADQTIQWFLPRM